jgi:hypothetical protein
VTSWWSSTPTNYKIAVSLAGAAVQQAQVNAQNIEREAKHRERTHDARSDR